MSLKPSLSPNQVKQIRDLRDKGWSQAALAARFRVSQSTIHNVITKKTYRLVS